MGWRWFPALLLLAVTVNAWGALPTPADACSADRIPLSASARLFVGDGADLSPDEVLALSAERWQFIQGRARLQLKHVVRWIRIDLRNATDTRCQRWLSVGRPGLREVGVYVSSGTGWDIMRAGAHFPVSEWPRATRHPMFPVTLPPHAAKTILVRIPARGSLVAFQPELWLPERYLQQEISSAMAHGMVFGGLFLLMLACLICGAIYRRPRLIYIALAVGFYVAHKAAENNYLLFYLWPDKVDWNIWFRYFVGSLAFGMFYLYAARALQVRRLGRWWSCLFMVAACGFLFVALFGAFMPDQVLTTRFLLRLDQVCRVLCLLALIVGWWKHTLRGWFPPLLVGLIAAQGMFMYGYWYVEGAIALDSMQVFATIALGVCFILLGTLISQVYQGRYDELRARATLARQRTTENERLERTVARRTEQLSHALQTRRQLLGRISHDLRSPLAGIIDSVRQWRAGDAKRDYAGLIERHAQQQMDMIDELLEFSRAELSGLQPQPVPGYLHAFINAVAEQTELAAEQRGNRLQRDFAGNLPALVSLDFHYLQRVLANLLGNANKYTDKGIIRFTVRKHAAVKNGSVALQFIVDDSGPGIAAADRQRLLQPFARGANALQQEGHGLGLSIVTQLLEHMGSQLHVDDAPGGGSRFHFELEVALATESDLEPVIEDSGAARADGAGRVILVVDDEAQQRDVTCDLLDSYGFDCIAACDGEAALQHVQTRPVDLVLTDQYMPGRDGWKLLKAVKKQYPQLPVVLYSSVPPRPAEAMDEQYAFDATLLKPANGATLVNQVDILARRADEPSCAATAKSGG